MSESKISKTEKMFDQTLLYTIPSGEMYFRSYMHRDNLQFVANSPSHNFFISMSIDGVIKFWHVLSNEIEFVKQIKTGDGQFFSYSVSFDEEYIATGTRNGNVYIFRIASFELVRKISFGEQCDVSLCFVNDPEILNYQLAVSLSTQSTIKIIEPLKDLGKESIGSKIEFPANKDQIQCIGFNQKIGIGASVDQKGFVMFWDLNGKCPEFEYKSVLQTNYLELLQIKKDKKVVSLTFSNDGKYLALCCTDWIVRVFDVNKGTIIRRFYDDLDGSKTYGLDEDYLKARVILENHYRQEFEYYNVSFDETGTILMLPSAFGIKFYNVKTGTLLRIIGRVEKQERYNSLCLISSPTPMLLATAFDKQRIYLFTNENGKDGKRDALNEKTTEERVKNTTRARRLVVSQLPKFATLHTMKGDIKFEMFADECPMTVENFVTHAKRGYYDNTRIIRVVRDFCIQMGDPTGTGIGGESIWGGFFEDEALENGHKFDEPFMVGMANEGKNKNGSQFFITTVVATHLNGKHTCWGRVISGKENIFSIQSVDTDQYNHPKQPILLVNITFSNDR